MGFYLNKFLFACSTYRQHEAHIYFVCLYHWSSVRRISQHRRETRTASSKAKTTFSRLRRLPDAKAKTSSKKQQLGRKKPPSSKTKAESTFNRTWRFPNAKAKAKKLGKPPSRDEADTSFYGARRCPVSNANTKATRRRMVQALRMISRMRKTRYSYF